MEEGAMGDSEEQPPSPDGSRITDKRAEFERITRRSGRDEEAERAFMESKIRMIRSDPALSEEEKADAIRLLLGQSEEQ
jgi:hypothetical protein